MCERERKIETERERELLNLGWIYQQRNTAGGVCERERVRERGGERERERAAQPRLDL